MAVAVASSAPALDTIGPGCDGASLSCGRRGPLKSLVSAYMGISAEQLLIVLQASVTTMGSIGIQNIY